jgi:hypothetical protein
MVVKGRKRGYWSFIVFAALLVAGLAACDLGPAAPDPATVDPGIVDRPVVDAGPSAGGLSNPAQYCGQPCGLTPDICLAGGDTCVVFCLDMEGPTGQPLAGDCYDDGDPAGWCVDLNNDHLCDAGVGTSTSYTCVDATLENIDAMRGGLHRTLCSRDGNPPFGCPARLTCDASGEVHVCGAAFCEQGPPLVDTPAPPVDQPTETILEVTTDVSSGQPTAAPTSNGEVVTCYCEINADGTGWSGMYICVNPDDSLAFPPEDRSMSTCPRPPTPLPPENGNPGGGSPVCGNGKVEKGEQCESDADCKGNNAGNTCFIPGCACGPG